MTTESLSDVIEGFGEDIRPELTIGQMLEQFDGRAFGAMLLVFGLLQLPAPAPGLVDVLGLPSCCWPRRSPRGSDVPWLPRKLVEHPLKRDDLRGLFRRLTPIVRRMELVTRPRLAILFGPIGERLIGVVCTLLALVLVLPIPLGNMRPAPAVACWPWPCCSATACWRCWAT